MTIKLSRNKELKTTAFIPADGVHITSVRNRGKGFSNTTAVPPSSPPTTPHWSSGEECSLSSLSFSGEVRQLSLQQ